MFPFSKERRHPAVIVSNDDTCQNPDVEELNALLCTSAKVNREPKTKPTVWIGKRWFAATGFIRCPKRGSMTRRGMSPRNRIARKVVEVLRLPIHRK